MTLFLLCQSEGLNPISALRRFHIIENRVSMRSDAMLAEFLNQGGAVTFHLRSDEMVAATFIVDIKKLDQDAQDRAIKRFELLWKLDAETDPAKRSVLMLEIGKIARSGEETIIRSYADCEAKGLTRGAGDKTKANWARHPREMLTARTITEGIRLVSPGLIAGVVESNEARDIADSEREEKAIRLANPQLRDAVHIEAAIKDYQEQAMETTNQQEKSRLLGLASDLRTRLEDLRLASKAPAGSTDPDDQLPGLRVVEAEVEVVTDWRSHRMEHFPPKGKQLGELSSAEIRVLWEKKAIKHIDDPSHFGVEARMVKQAFDSLPQNGVK